VNKGNRGIIADKILVDLYVKQKRSAKEISKILNCSENKVNYWLLKYAIEKRSISEAVYAKCNPNGDPFKFVPPKTPEDFRLFGLGVGLYWGEGTKADKNQVRLGNSDPKLILAFMKFLRRFFSIEKSEFKFHLHTFSDIDTEEAVCFWKKELGIARAQFYKPTVTQSGKLGTCRKKSKYGVITVHFSNTKLRDIMVGLIDSVNKPL